MHKTKLNKLEFIKRVYKVNIKKYCKLLKKKISKLSKKYARKKFQEYFLLPKHFDCQIEPIVK